MCSYRSLHPSGEGLETDFLWSWSRLGLEVFIVMNFAILLKTTQLTALPQFEVAKSL